MKILIIIAIFIICYILIQVGKKDEEKKRIQESIKRRDEEFKAKQDKKAKEMFGKPYNQLTDEQRCDVLMYDTRKRSQEQLERNQKALLEEAKEHGYSDIGSYIYSEEYIQKEEELNRKVAILSALAEADNQRALEDIANREAEWKAKEEVEREAEEQSRERKEAFEDWLEFKKGYKEWDIPHISYLKREDLVLEYKKDTGNELEQRDLL